MKERGPFNLGKWSRVINISSFAVSPQFYFLCPSIVLYPWPMFLWQFIIFICVLFVLPTARPVTPSNMNYAVVSVGGIFLIVGLAWVTWGRTHFVRSVHTNSGAGSLGPSDSEIPSKGWKLHERARYTCHADWIHSLVSICMYRKPRSNIFRCTLQLHQTFQIPNWLECTKWTEKNSSYKWTKCWRWELD